MYPPRSNGVLQNLLPLRGTPANLHRRKGPEFILEANNRPADPITLIQPGVNS